MRTNWLASIWRCYSRQSKRGQITGAIPLPGLPASARARSLLRQYQECYDPAAVRPEREPAHPNPTILQTRAPESRNALKGCKTLILFEKSNSLNISALAPKRSLAPQCGFHLINDTSTDRLPGQVLRRMDPNRFAHREVSVLVRTKLEHTI